MMCVARSAEQSANPAPAGFFIAMVCALRRKAMWVNVELV